MTAISIEKLREELAKLDGTPPPAAANTASSMTKKGVMRALYPQICQLLEKGWKAKDLVKWLDGHGVKIKSEGMFRVYLFELDQENGRSRRQSITLTTSEPVPPPVAAPVSNQARQPAPEMKQQPVQKKNGDTQEVAASSEEINFEELASGFSMPQTNEKGFVEMPGKAKK